MNIFRWKTDRKFLLALVMRGLRTAALFAFGAGLSWAFLVNSTLDSAQLRRYGSVIVGMGVMFWSIGIGMQILLTTMSGVKVFVLPLLWRLWGAIFWVACWQMGDWLGFDSRLMLSVVAGGAVLSLWDLRSLLNATQVRASIRFCADIRRDLSQDFFRKID